MAPLPSNGTPRIFMDYTSNTVQHTLLLRPEAGGGTPGDYADAYAAAFAPLMLATDSFYRVRYSELGSDFSVPIEFTPIHGTQGGETTLWPQDNESVQLSFVFRDLTTGRRGRVELFTPCSASPWPADNRYNPGEQATITAALTAFTALARATGDFPLLSIAGYHVTVYQYVNIRLNSYWQTKQRG